MAGDTGRLRWRPPGGGVCGVGQPRCLSYPCSATGAARCRRRLACGRQCRSARHALASLLTATSASHITRPFNPDNATRWPAVYSGLPWLVPGYGGALLWVYDLSLVRLAVG